MRGFLLFLLAASASASAQSYDGHLAAGDDQLPSGEFVDEFTVTPERGQTVRAVVTSDEFDTYVIVKTASDEQAEDDDCTDGETTRSCAELAVDEEGPVRILVTSFKPGETGAYRVTVMVGTPSSAGGPLLALEPGDVMLPSGELADTYTLSLEAGERVDIGARSSAFNPYLIATGPGDARVENDDCTEGDRMRSCIVIGDDAAGEWHISVTSAQPGEMGPYTLNLGGHEPASQDTTPPKAP